MDTIHKLVWKQRLLQIGVLPHCKLIREISLSINIVWVGAAKANTKEGISCNANLPSDTNANRNNLGVNKLQCNLLMDI